MPRTAVRENVRVLEVADREMADRLRGGPVEVEDQLDGAVGIWNAMRYMVAILAGMWIGRVLYHWVVS